MSQVGFFTGGTATFYDAFDEAKSARGDTLLARYVKKHPLTESDYKHIAAQIVDNAFGDQNLGLRVIQHWANINTNSTLPLELLERTGATRPTALAEEIRLLPKHAWLLEQGKRDIASLHFYERVLMRAYRLKRNAFHLPETQHLREVLDLLVERDPQNRRVFELHLAELAWDSGDDAKAHDYGISGLNPDTAKTKPYRFILDELAPRQVITDLIESALASGQLKQAAKLADLATTRKFLTPGEYYFAPLDLALRKTTAAIQAATAAPAAGAELNLPARGAGQ
jgi:hypothetical protein